MSESDYSLPPRSVEIGQRLSGLLVHAEERPEGLEYWDQIIESPYGKLYYAPEQYRNGMLRWITNHGEVCIRVESGTGKVVDIDPEASQRQSEYYSHIYEMGMEAYQELKRRIAAGDDPN